MQKGVLHEKKFHLKAPTVKQELGVFNNELQERMKKYGIKKLVFLEKLENDILHVVAIPASATSAASSELNSAFQAQGFSQSTSVQNVSSFSHAEINPVSVTFGKPKFK